MNIVYAHVELKCSSGCAFHTLLEITILC